MKVMFYEIQDCEYEPIDSKPAVIAPEGTDAELLRKYRFIQLLDGRWCHYMNMDEIDYMNNRAAAQAVVFSDEMNIAPPRRRLSRESIRLMQRIGSLLLLLIGGCLFTADFMIGYVSIGTSFVLLMLSFYDADNKKVPEWRPITDNSQQYTNPSHKSRHTGLLVVIIILLLAPIMSMILFVAAINACVDSVTQSANDTCTVSEE